MKFSHGTRQAKKTGAFSGPEKKVPFPQACFLNFLQGWIPAFCPQIRNDAGQPRGYTEFLRRILHGTDSFCYRKH
jgi:hypothetical protein